jgi:integrase
MASRAKPILDSFQSIPGYPDKLKIYRIEESPFWYVRAWMDDRMVVRTTKKKVQSQASSFAKTFYDELLLKRAQGEPLTQSFNFVKATESLLEVDRGRVERSESKPSLVKDFEYILKKDMMPFFQRYNVVDINYNVIQEYVTKLQERGIGSKTIKNHLGHLSKVLTQAIKIGLLETMPVFPKVSITENPRGWFNEPQFVTVQGAIRKAIRDKMVVRFVPITEQLQHVVNFMVNTFLRPQDIKLLKNKDITPVKKPDGRSYLRIMAQGKTRPAPVISTKAAVSLYEQFLKGEQDDYVFLPDRKDRDYAMQILARQFKYILEQCGLKKDELGQDRTLYSLRHTAIMNQLIHGEIKIQILAKNCRTSVEMIEKFYGSHLQAEMAVNQFHQSEEAGDNLEDLFG